ncbi:hypothetical protein BU14_2552s0001 [Porphyra umbilicalis]|uniref:Uncharacterized protein n=1 Tax=Porphyra umbilicalis TaxID=2786 RepID=A0A1X6NIY6_PORUM|nr:hypothetical protein BU14_2552s0001 [Porphyra umbilicalis]|eukprot:OSX68577.1 hypothetical protein BU14_2552s0001 [Porphyra umbilicalis]
MAGRRRDAIGLRARRAGGARRGTPRRAARPGAAARAATAARPRVGANRAEEGAHVSEQRRARRQQVVEQLQQLWEGDDL